MGAGTSNIDMAVYTWLHTYSNWLVSSLQYQHLAYNKIYGSSVCTFIYCYYILFGMKQLSLMLNAILDAKHKVQHKTTTRSVLSPMTQSRNAALSTSAEYAKLCMSSTTESLYLFCMLLPFRDQTTRRFPEHEKRGWRDRTELLCCLYLSLMSHNYALLLVFRAHIWQLWQLTHSWCCSFKTVAEILIGQLDFVCNYIGWIMGKRLVIHDHDGPQLYDWFVRAQLISRTVLCFFL